MKLDKDEYKMEEVQGMLDEINTELADLKLQLGYKDEEITTLTEQVEGYGDLKKSNLETNVKLELTKAGLSDDYFDLVVSDDLQSSLDKINKLVEINKTSIVDNSFRPQEHRSNNEYEQAEKQGNTQDMVKSKLSKLFR